jgi:hypothetical protein
MGGESTPAVMLSPNARNLVSAIRGTGLTVTANVQALARDCASVAVHVTFVTPTGNAVSAAGEHTTDTGGAPPVTVGAPNPTRTAPSSGDSTSTPAGHAITGAAGGAGAVGLPPQEATKAVAITATAILQQRVQNGGLVVGRDFTKVFLRPGNRRSGICRTSVGCLAAIRPAKRYQSVCNCDKQRGSTRIHADPRGCSGSSRIVRDDGGSGRQASA